MEQNVKIESILKESIWIWKKKSEFKDWSSLLCYMQRIYTHTHTDILAIFLNF